MIKVYDSNHTFLSVINDGLRNFYTTDTLETGTRSLCFQVPCAAPYLSLMSEENYIATQDYEFIIKEIVLEDNDFFTIYCSANIEEIYGYVFDAFDLYQQNPEAAYAYCLSGVSSWQIEYYSEDRTALTIQLPNVSALDMIREIQKQTNQEVWFDTANKILYIYDKLGSTTPTAYYSNEVRLQQLSKQSSTYDYATVLYPYGKNGLTIGVINNGQNYIENYGYTNKRIVKVWEQPDIEVPERLLGAARDYLDSIAQPNRSYKVLLSDVDEDTALGDAVMIVDAIKHLRYSHRIVKLVRYPNEPERSYIELSNRQSDFARTFIKNQKVVEKELKYIRSVLETLT